MPGDRETDDGSSSNEGTADLSFWKSFHNSSKTANCLNSYSTTVRRVKTQIEEQKVPLQQVI